MVYDVRDRLVMMRDSGLAKQSQWIVYKYDSINRPIRTYMISSASIAYHTPGWLLRQISITPRCLALILMFENYYDNYSWVTTPTPQTGVSSTLYATDSIHLLILIRLIIHPRNTRSPLQPSTLENQRIENRTAQSVTGSTTFLYAANFYDAEGRVYP